MWKYLIRPVLFLLDAETAHHLTFWLFKWVCRIPGCSGLIKTLYAIPDQQPVEVFGLRFKNQVGLAAGLDKDGKYITELSLLGFSHIEIGTVTPRPQPGNPRPRLFRLPKDQALINRMGFNNEGADALAQRLKTWNKPANFILGINIGKNKDTPLDQATGDYLACFEKLYPYADYFTVNISSPNTPGLRGLQDKGPLNELLAAMVKANDHLSQPKPILVKLAPDLDDIQLAEVKEIILSHGISGIIMGNTTLDRSGLKTEKGRIEKIGAGGLSGLPLLNKSNERLGALIKLPGDIPVIGVGGIMDGVSGRSKLRAGAVLIQVYSGFIYEGPGLVRKICTALNHKSADPG